jgi:hypothetical protein
VDREEDAEAKEEEATVEHIFFVFSAANDYSRVFFFAGD